MKILIIYRHFWPDSPPYASMLRSIAKQLVSDGHNVTLLCEQPCYKLTDGKNDKAPSESIDGIQVLRIPRLPLWHKAGLVRTAGKLLFPFRAYRYSKAHLKRTADFDLVWTATIPPVISGAMGLKTAKYFSAKFLYHCQDLYPEIAVHMKMIRLNGLMHRVLKHFEKTTRQNADYVVSLSEDMKKTIENLAEPSGQYETINNFLLENFNQPGPTEGTCTDESLFKSNETINIVFAGNIGQFQGLEKIVTALVSLGDEGHAIHLAFMGEGKALSGIKNIATGAKNITFASHKPFDKALPLIANADYGLVSLEPDIYKFAYPSKTLTYLGLSVPLVVVVEPASQLVKTITDNNLGYYAEGSSEQSISDMFRQMIDQKASREVHKQNASNFYQSTCSRSSILNRWSTLLCDEAQTSTKERSRSQDTHHEN